MGGGITIAMLPNTAPHRCNAVCHLLPFTKWILKSTLGPIQAQMVTIAFNPETITWQVTWQWDPINNYVFQAECNLIGCTLNDFPIYNLTTEMQPPTTITTNNTTSQTMSHTRLATATANNTGGCVNDLDSLSNSMLSQGTWFITTTTQIDAIASRQNRLKQQTLSQRTMIMAQLETICTLMEEQWQWQDQYKNQIIWQFINDKNIDILQWKTM